MILIMVSLIEFGECNYGNCVTGNFKESLIVENQITKQDQTIACHQLFDKYLEPKIFVTNLDASQKFDILKLRHDSVTQEPNQIEKFHESSISLEKRFGKQFRKDPEETKEELSCDLVLQIEEMNQYYVNKRSKEFKNQESKNQVYDEIVKINYKKMEIYEEVKENFEKSYIKILEDKINDVENNVIQYSWDEDHQEVLKELSEESKNPNFNDEQEKNNYRKIGLNEPVGKVLNLIYSELLPKHRKAAEIFAFGLLGAGKSTLINFYLFFDLDVLYRGYRYVLEVNEEKKKVLNKECEIVHQNFIVYIGGIKETVKNEKCNQCFHEIHLNLEKNISDKEFLECFNESEIKLLEGKCFQMVISGCEIENRNFRNYMMVYIKSIDEIIQKFISFNGNLHYEEVLTHFELVISKAHILENRNTIKLKFEKLKEEMQNMSIADYLKEKYENILNHFIKNTNQIYFLFRVDKEGSFTEIIHQYDCLSI